MRPLPPPNPPDPTGRQGDQPPFFTPSPAHSLYTCQVGACRAAGAPSHPAPTPAHLFVRVARAYARDVDLVEHDLVLQRQLGARRAQPRALRQHVLDPCQLLGDAQDGGVGGARLKVGVLHRVAGVCERPAHRVGGKLLKASGRGGEGEWWWWWWWGV
eukprot:352181-Chlamydomonas_euryale.AAC.2